MKFWEKLRFIVLKQCPKSENTAQVASWPRWTQQQDTVGGKTIKGWMGLCGGHCFHLIQNSFASQSTNWHVIRTSWMGCGDARIKGIGTDCDNKASVPSVIRKMFHCKRALRSNCGESNSPSGSWVLIFLLKSRSPFKTIKIFTYHPLHPQSCLPAYLPIFRALCWHHEACVFIIPQILLFGEM